MQSPRHAPSTSNYCWTHIYIYIYHKCFYTLTETTPVDTSIKEEGPAHRGGRTHFSRHRILRQKIAWSRI